MRLIAGAAALLVAASAQAAEITTSVVDAVSVVTVSGEITEGDSDKFDAVVRPLTGPVLVSLRSPGGNLGDSLAIGLSIHRNRMPTAVGNGATCASACGLIWLAGEPRYVGETARIGFHAAYVGDGWTAHEVGSGNAVVGAFLSGLGYSIPTIAYLTDAAPNDMQWLTPDDAHKFGIGFVAVPRPDATPLAASPPRPAPIRTAEERAAAATMIRYYTQWSGPDVEAMAAFYGQSVNFYGKDMPTSKMMVEKRKFVARWPVRTFTVKPESMYVHCTDLCAVTGVVEWNVSSPERGVRSTGTANFAMKLAGNSIASENGSVLSNHVDLLTPSSPPVATATSPTQPVSLVPTDPAPQTSAFADGRRDRITYEQWFTSLPEGAYRSGALYYATNRSKKASCDVGSDATFMQGCVAARDHLSPIDARRHSEADYRSGWNSP